MKKYILFILIINIILSIILTNKNEKNTENNIYLDSNTINIVDYLKNKSNNKEIQEYENGNKQEMFVFEHPEIDQVNTNTDYRYIGDNPNNYLYFNCTDDNEINSEDTNASNTSITNNQTIDNPETVDNGIKYVKIMIFVSVILIIIINIKLKKKMI